jgi:cyclopropane fatty-acyl-phospholipid synthase-like methyltransferase
MTVFDRAYEATPSWEIGHPQPVVTRLADAGLVEGTVLDVGCGTGENALELARRGLRVVGIDIAAAAVERARARAAERGIAAEFLTVDAMHLATLERVFDTVMDVGLFHVLQSEERRPYADSLRRVTRSGGRCLLVCWSSRNPFGVGPARITRRAIHEAFSAGWRVEAIEPETLETRLEMRIARAWLARIRAI